MIPHVVEAKYKNDYCIWVKFNDGSEGIVDLKDELYVKCLNPSEILRNLNRFD